MKNLIFFYTSLLYILFSCSISKKTINHDFIITDIFYQDKIEIDRFYYNSNTNSLQYRNQILKISLTTSEKKEIYNYYKELKIKHSIFIDERKEKSIENFSFSLEILFNNSSNSNKITCDEAKIFKAKSLAMKIRNIIKSKKEFQEKFPRVDEEY